ncbi:MAG: FG-GAP-like repeat-containing protein [Planctomycetota bacterium]
MTLALNVVPLCLSIPCLLATPVAGAQGTSGFQTLYEFVGENPGDELGFSVAVVDDFDGDGCPDIACGMRNWDGTAGSTTLFNVGRVVVRSGRTGGVIRDHRGTEAEDQLGYSITSISDLDNDGVGELVVGEPTAAGRGTVRVYSGASGAELLTIDGTPLGPNGFDGFGRWVAGAGDLNGDGLEDILVCAPLQRGATGEVYVYSGATGGLLRTMLNPNLGSGDLFGISAASLGDLTGDGWPEFIIGEMQQPVFINGARGVAHVYDGADMTYPHTILSTLQGALPTVTTNFGRAVARLADLNGDGRSELAVGASGPPGVVTVYTYDGQGFVPYFSQPVVGVAEHSFGTSVCAVGDWDGDSVPDFAVGAPNDSAPNAPPGFVRVCSGVDGGTLFELTGDELGDRFGFSLAGGDVNGDGFPDLVIGARLSSAGGTNAGKVKVVTTSLATGSGGAELSLVIPDCQDDLDPSTPGQQIAVEMQMTGVSAPGATGFFGAIAYDLGELAYVGDLSSYGAAFPLHIQGLLQGDDGLLEVDGSVGLGGGTTVVGSATLATLVFTLVASPTASTPAIAFDRTGLFPSELSYQGVPIQTSLVDPAPVVLDDTPPVFQAHPALVRQAADALPTGSCAGAIVLFVPPLAVDERDPAPQVVCTPASGSHFPVGVTTVVCAATDSCGNQAVTQFDVQVDPVNLVELELQLEGSVAPTTRCIMLRLPSCASQSVPVLFMDHDTNPATPPRGFATFEVPCGDLLGLEVCVKDQQHTLWERIPLQITDVHYSGAVTGLLRGGDTDDDGDVDIHDVTLLIAQYGMPHQPGGCAWSGVRDADFDNDGVVGAADYTFLTTHWLESTSCPCASPFVGGRGRARSVQLRVPATNARLQQADLNRDGFTDVTDVELFEVRHGLPRALSRRMRGQ